MTAPEQAPSPRLLPQHQRLIAASAISPEVAAARGYQSAQSKSDFDRAGFADYQRRPPGLLIPVRSVDGKVGTYQYRPDKPRVVNGKSIKYETKAGARLILDVPPMVRTHLKDPSKPLWITEGSRKADAAVSVKLTCIALLGVWGWRGTGAAGGKTALADWESIALNDRDVYLAFDSDVMTKPEVHQALSRLQAFLASRGAKVHFVYLPAASDGVKVGLDDYLAAGHAVEDLLALAADELRPCKGEVPVTGASDVASRGPDDDADTSDAFGLPAFPMDAFPPHFQRLTEHFAAAVEAKPDLVAPATLAATASGLGPDWRVGARSFIRPARLWFGQVASSGLSKTPAITPLLAPLHDEDRRLGKAHESAEQEYALALRDWNKSGKEEATDKPVRPRRVRAALTDITPEGLVTALAASRRGLMVHSDELAQLLTSLDTYHARPGRGRAVFLSLWSGTRIAEGRKTAEESEVDDPFAVLFGGIQPSILSRLQLADGDGLCARFLFGIVRGKAGGLGQSIHPEAEALWQCAMALALSHQVEMIQCFDLGAIALLDERLRGWKQRAIDLEDAGSGLLAAMYGKAGDHCVRLVAVLHGMDAIDAALTANTAAPVALSGGIVPRSTVVRAVRLVDYYLAHGAAVARLVVARGVDPGELLADDRELAKHLRSLVGSGDETVDSAAGWAARLKARGIRMSPSKLGRAFVRLEAAPAANLRIERQPRGDDRGWRVCRGVKASEATEASGAHDLAAWSTSVDQPLGDGSDDGRDIVRDSSPTLPTLGPRSDGTAGVPRPPAPVASDASVAATRGNPLACNGARRGRVDLDIIRYAGAAHEQAICSDPTERDVEAQVQGKLENNGHGPPSLLDRVCIAEKALELSIREDTPEAIEHARQALAALTSPGNVEQVEADIRRGLEGEAARP